jgi:hypothetical protein
MTHRIIDGVGDIRETLFMVLNEKLCTGERPRAKNNQVEKNSIRCFNWRSKRFCLSRTIYDGKLLKYFASLHFILRSILFVCSANEPVFIRFLRQKFEFIGKFN